MTVDTKVVPTPSPADGKRVATTSDGLPAHAYETKRVTGVNGFLWWVVGVRYPVEVRDEKLKQISLSGKPKRWHVAGPFATKAIAEKCIDPTARHNPP